MKSTVEKYPVEGIERPRKNISHRILRRISLEIQHLEIVGSLLPEQIVLVGGDILDRFHVRFKPLS
jgi:hypothetical protein